MTLSFLHDETRILLGMKKRGFGQGRWNGFGGKVRGNESIKDAALREITEEAGVKALAIRKRGLLSFLFSGQPDILEVHVFSVADFAGTPQETEEMRPQWFSKRQVPYGEMWPDDQYWLPLLMSNKKFHGFFHFFDINTLVNHSIEELLDPNHAHLAD